MTVGIAAQNLNPFGNPLEIRRPRLLLVEGPGDVGFFGALLRANNRARVQIESLGSESNLGATIPTLLRIPGFESLEWLGVALDADADARAQVDGVRAAFENVSTLTIAKPASG